MPLLTLQDDHLEVPLSTKTPIKYERLSDRDCRFRVGIQVESSDLPVWTHKHLVVLP
jgi:hypothetical protein